MTCKQAIPLLLKTLSQTQTTLRRCLQNESSHDALFHSEISPIGWHLAHTLYVESYWVGEQLLGKKLHPHLDEQLYMPEHSLREHRGQCLPQRDKLIGLATKIQNQTRSLLFQHSSHALLKNNYLTLFLIQHHAIHLETLAMARLAQRLRNPAPHYHPTQVLQAEPLHRQAVIFKQRQYTVGSERAICFDNEKPSTLCTRPSFALNRFAVSNAEYLAFMQKGGYKNSALWSDDGWQWLQTAQVFAPHHWKQNKYGQWFGIHEKGPYTLPPHAPVQGINYFEASAFARFYGVRLPHEHELEIAAQQAQQGLVSFEAAQTWQWCSNTFYAYEGFEPFPYMGYSTPWFDGKHYVLKGGSQHTHYLLKRPSYRNFYTPEKRHIFSGMRIAYNLY